MNYKKYSKIILYSIIFFLLFIIFVNIYIILYSNNYIKTNINDFEKTKVWLVLWAKVNSDWTPSPILKDRLITAYEFYNLWIIKKILVSWDNWVSHYNEPKNMEKYLVNLWVEKDDIYLDYAWFDTYDSMYRAKEIFWVEELIVFTQNFHLYRSVYIWNRLWIKTKGAKTNLQPYYWMKRNNIREIWARVKAFFDLEILKSKPKFLWEKVSMDSIQEKVE